MRVEVWSDVVCPWCFIGKRRFETALQRVSQTVDTSSVEIVYRAYQLDPTAPPGAAQPVTQAYAKKFGGEVRAKEILQHVTAVAAQDGIEFNMDIALRANTLLAHRLLWLVGERDRLNGSTLQPQYKERLLQAYFTQGRNIADPEVLVECASEVVGGIAESEVRQFLAGDSGRAEVMEEVALAASHGISAVPTFVFDGQWSVPGAQDVEVFERVLTRLLATQAALPVPLSDQAVCRDDACDL